MSDRTEARSSLTNPAALSSAKIRSALAGIPQQPTTEKADRNGKVTVSIRGQAVTINCPAWCVLPHTEQYNCLEDVYHQGETIALAAPQFGGQTEVMVAAIRQDPFYIDADRGLPYWSLDAAGDGSDTALAPTAALALIDQAAAHLNKMRAQIEQLAEVTQ